jgi:hypothetical protein
MSPKNNLSLTQHCRLLNPLKDVHIWDGGEQSRLILGRKAVQLPEELNRRETGKCPNKCPAHFHTHFGSVNDGTEGEEDGTIPGIIHNFFRSLNIFQNIRLETVFVNFLN